MPYFDDNTLNLLVRDEIRKMRLDLSEDAIETILRVFKTEGVIESANNSITLAKGRGRRAVFKRHDKRIRKNARSYITAIVRTHGRHPSSTKAIVETITHHTQNPPKQLAARSRPYHPRPFPCKPRTGTGEHPEV